MTGLSLTGAGSVGHLQPGWAVTEQATAVAIGESNGSVGSARLSVGMVPDTKFVGGDTVELSHDDLGTWQGRINEVSTRAGSASLSASGVTAALVATATAKPFMAGTPISNFAFPTAVYGFPQGMAVDSSGTIYVYSQLPTAAAPATSYITKWSANGEFLALLTDSLPGLGGSNGETGSAITTSYFMALDPTEQFIYFRRSSNNLIQKISTAGTYVTSFVTGGSSDGQIGFAGPGGMAVAANGDLYMADWANDRVMVVGPTGTYVTKWGTPGSGTGQFINDSLTDLALDAAGKVYTLEGRVTERVQIFTPIGVYVSSFVLPAEVANANSIAVNPAGTQIYVQVKVGAVPMIYVFDPSGTVLASWPGGGNLDPSLRTIGNGLHYKNDKLYYRSFSLGTEYTPRGGDMITTAVPYPSLSAAFAYYMNFLVPSLGLDYQATTNPPVALPGWSGDVWAHIKELCTAYGVEWSVTDGVATIRDIGSATLEIKNHSPITMSASSRGGSRALMIRHQNAVSGNDLTMYTASSVITVAVLESRTNIYQTDAHPLQLNPPTPTDALTATAGTYHVQDANGLDVPAASWTYYGGSVDAVAGDRPGQIRLDFQGPRGIIPGFTGPFSFASGAGSNRTPQLSVTGTGVTVDPVTLTVRTGADPVQAATSVGATIDNFGVASAAQAYSRGSWAQDLAQGLDTSITFEIAVSALAGFGLDVGSLITLDASRYRVTDISYGNLTASVTAHRHATYADFAAALPGASTYTDLAAMWSGFTYADMQVEPLRAS